MEEGAIREEKAIKGRRKQLKRDSKKISKLIREEDIDRREGGN